MATLNANSFSLDDFVNIEATYHNLKSTLYINRDTASPELPASRENICLDLPRFTNNQNFSFIFFI
jgi:hypothetical protein